MTNNSPSTSGELDPKGKHLVESSAPQGKPQKSRHRASVACASCRDRRIRCVVPSGGTECTQCKRSGVECIIKNDDERRRPISRAYMASLTDRVALLEGMLKEKGAELPPANHPPKTRTRNPNDHDQEHSPQRPKQPPQAPPAIQDNSSPSSAHDGSVYNEHSDQQSVAHSHQSDDVESTSSPPVFPAPKKEGMVNRLLSTRGHLSFDQLGGRLRYFGPTTNCHVHSDANAAMHESRENLEQARRAERTIRFLSMETHDYLMDLFWQNYNSVLHVIHEEAFHEDRDNGRTQFYSAFLHICVLAMGYRFADKNRHDMQRIALPDRESTLHREAKYMLEFELERPGGIPSVVALLILGDLECGVGRDNIGWLYAGLAVRLAFDIGLHLDSRNTGLPQREVEIRQMTLWACVVYDKYWALFLGRPTSMKSSDLEVSSLSKQFERLGACKPAGESKSLETMIYEALLDLMELAGKITEGMDPRSMNEAHVNRNAYLRMAALDRELGNWYARLPEPLRWTPQNIKTAPFSFFLLHQQYHSALILLHRPFAMYEDSSETDSEETNGTENHFSALSRTVCTKHAVRVTRIFWQHRQRFDTKRIFVTGMQHAGTAATALIAALAYIKDSNDRDNNMQYLECLAAALQDMAYTYQPAESMSLVLQAVMAELRGRPFDFGRPDGFVIPARRGSTVEDSEPFSFKRRQTVKSVRRTSFRRPSSSRSSRPGNIDLDANGYGFNRLDGDSDRPDGFVMVTPRSEIGSWPGLTTADTPLDLQMLPTPSTTGPGLVTPSVAPNRNAWMGSEVDSADISHLVHVHFPEIPNIPESEGSNANTNLDFLSLGTEDWKDWAGSGGSGPMNTDLDGFPSSGDGFGPQFTTTPGKYSSGIVAG